MMTWANFWGLALIWGSSFLFMKMALRQVDAVGVAAWRLGIAAVMFAVFLKLTRRAWPTDRATITALIVVGILNTALPFTLMAWGTAYIDSGMATILTATTPFFALGIAHVFVAGESLTMRKLAGLVIGFSGVVVLGSRGLSGEQPLIGQLAVLGGALCYGLSLTIIRLFLRHIEPIRVAATTIIVGAVAILPFAVAFAPATAPLAEWTPEVIVSVAALGVVHTVAAYFLFYHLVDVWGPRAALVTFAMPPIGVVLGVIVLDEMLTWHLLVGGVLILTGILLSRASSRPRRTPAPVTVSPAE